MSCETLYPATDLFPAADLFPCWSASKPTVTVEMALTTNPAEAPSWTTVASSELGHADQRIRGFSRRGGASSELEETQPRTFSLTLDNRDRKFDQTNESSSLWPNLKPMKRIRVTAEWETGIHPVYTGYVESYTQRYEGSVDAVTEIQCVDAFKALSLAERPTSDDYPEVVDSQLSPIYGYWRMNEPRATKVVAGGTRRVRRPNRPGKFRKIRRPDRKVPIVVGQSGPEALVVGKPEFQVADADGPILGESTYGIRFDRLTVSKHLKIPVTDGDARPGAENKITVSCMFRQDDFLIGSGYHMLIAGPTSSTTGVAVWGLFVSGGEPVFFVYFDDAPGSVLTTGSEASVPLDEWTHLLGTWDGSVAQLFMNGVRVVRQTASGKTMRRGTTGNPIFIGEHEDTATDELTENQTVGAIAEVVISEAALPDLADNPAAQELYNSAVNGYGTPADKPSAGVRVEEILATAAVGLDEAIGAGTVNVQPQRLDGSSLLELIREVEQTEGGVFFVARDGTVTFLDRDYQTGAGAAIDATFGDGAGEIPYTHFVPAGDSEFLRNIVRVNPSESDPQEARDQTSVDAYLPAVLDVGETLHVSAAAGLAHAENLLARYKEPANRVREVTVVGRADIPETFTQILERELYDRVLVNRRPPGGGLATYDVRVRGEALDAGPDRWTATWSLAPEEF